jgi:hypothetical protein
LIAKSRQYIKIVATTMVVTWTADAPGSNPNIDKKPPTISLTQASVISEMMVAKPPPTNKRLRLPQGMRQLSLRMPIYGWTRVPVKGPAIHTNASSDLLIPRDSRYG